MNIWSQWSNQHKHYPHSYFFRTPVTRRTRPGWGGRGITTWRLSSTPLRQTGRRSSAWGQGRTSDWRPNMLSQGRGEHFVTQNTLYIISLLKIKFTLSECGAGCWLDVRVGLAWCRPTTSRSSVDVTDNSNNNSQMLSRSEHNTKC